MTFGSLNESSGHVFFTVSRVSCLKECVPRAGSVTFARSTELEKNDVQRSQPANLLNGGTSSSSFPGNRAERI